MPNIDRWRNTSNQISSTLFSMQSKDLCQRIFTDPDSLPNDQIEQAIGHYRQTPPSIYSDIHLQTNSPYSFIEEYSTYFRHPVVYTQSMQQATSHYLESIRFHNEHERPREEAEVDEPSTKSFRYS